MFQKCYACKAQFVPLAQKHHCRACGQGFCSDCSNKVCSVQYLPCRLLVSSWLTMDRVKEITCALSPYLILTSLHRASPCCGGDGATNLSESVIDASALTVTTVLLHLLQYLLQYLLHLLQYLIWYST